MSQFCFCLNLSHSKKSIKKFLNGGLKKIHKAIDKPWNFKFQDLLKKRRKLNFYPELPCVENHSNCECIFGDFSFSRFCETGSVQYADAFQRKRNVRWSLGIEFYVKLNGRKLIYRQQPWLIALHVNLLSARFTTKPFQVNGTLSGCAVKEFSIKRRSTGVKIHNRRNFNQTPLEVCASKQFPTRPQRKLVSQ